MMMWHHVGENRPQNREGVNWTVLIVCGCPIPSFVVGVESQIALIDEGCGMNFFVFLHLFCHDFRKINGRIKIFKKCTSGAVPHGGRSSYRRGA
jgi:hypothetical protein